ncbi:MAG: helix-turn-helix transcriptional regulator [Clostridia bacterium]|nr:helix-turn-helix transcriptional regulator [Clostridia bacterium]
MKELRLEHEISQMELSKRTGISQSAIAKWELSKTEPTATAIVIIANFFSVTTDFLLGVE